MVGTASANIDDFLIDCESKLAPVFDVVAKASSSDPASLLAPKTLTKIEEIQHRGGVTTGLATRFSELDRLTGGLHPGETVVLAAGTGRGKTTLALNIAANVARHGIGVAFFSVEMLREQLMTRLLCSEAEVPLWKVRGARLSGEDLALLGAAAGKVATWPMTMIEGALTPARLKSLTRRYVRTGAAKLAIIDYLHLMSTDKRADNREREIAAISRAIKLLAVEMHIPILLLAQLNRKAMGKPRRPVLSDLRESGQIENDADQVWFLFRKDGHLPERSNDPGPARADRCQATPRTDRGAEAISPSRFGALRRPRGAPAATEM